MLGISKPRAATSVATKASISPFLKLSRILIRSSWLLSPCMAAALIPTFSSARDKRAQPMRLFEKIMHCSDKPCRLRVSNTFCKAFNLSCVLTR